MSDLATIVGPVLFEGGRAAEYAVEILKNGGLGTRHLPSGKLVPHVLSKAPADLVAQGLPVPGTSSSLMPLGQVAASPVQVGLLAANLGVGLLNLGVSAWTAYKVHKIDKKIDGLTAQVAGVDSKLGRLTGLLEISVVHLDGLIRNNALMLGLLMEHQQQIGHGIDLLRQELAEGVQSLHDALSTGEARREARELEQQMRELFRYYETCTRTIATGGEPSHQDLRRIIEIAAGLIAWIDTRLAAIPVGRGERLPLFVARAFALRLEMDARSQMEGAAGEEDEYRRLRTSIRDEVNALVEGAPLMALAGSRQALIEEYVFLHRALRGSATVLQLGDGSSVVVFPDDLLRWDDGLQPVRELVALPTAESAPQRIELRTLEEHDGWRRLSGLPRGAAEDEVLKDDLFDAFGLDSGGAGLSESGIRELLREGPDSLEAAVERIKREVDE